MELFQNYLSLHFVTLLHCKIHWIMTSPSDDNVLKKEGNNLLTRDLKEIWRESDTLNWIRGGEFSNCQNCKKGCEFSCPLARSERKEEYHCSFERRTN